MKTKMNRLVSYLVFLVAIVSVAACKHHHDPAPSAQDVFTKNVSQSWVVTAVSVDGKDVTSTFAGFTFMLKSDKSYTTTNNPLHGVFGTAGVYDVKSNASTATNGLFDLLLDNSVTLTVTELTASELKFGFAYTGSNARVTGVSGNYQVTMTVK